jgi:FkbM family methyltransferase
VGAGEEGGRAVRLVALAVTLMAVLATAAVVCAPATARTSVRFAWERHYHTPAPEWLQDWAGQPVPVWYTMEPHVRMFLDPWDMGPRMILESGEYEKLSMGYLAERLGPGRTFVDVGANFGVYSLVMAARGASVVAVEPNPESVTRLAVNVAASGAEVEIVPAACGDKDGIMPLYLAPEENTGMTSLARSNAVGGVKQYQVRVRTLDEILGGRRVDAIKIDVEGAEEMVLRGAQETLARWHPMILVELIDRQLRAMGSSEAAVRMWLWSAGYREGRRDGDNVEWVWRQ